VARAMAAFLPALNSKSLQKNNERYSEILAVFGANFADKRRSLDPYSSLAFKFLRA
jgi:hypothetical protein